MFNCIPADDVYRPINSQLQFVRSVQLKDNKISEKNWGIKPGPSNPATSFCNTEAHLPF